MHQDSQDNEYGVAEEAYFERGRAAGRADGIREAIEIADELGGEAGALMRSSLESLLTATPPPAATSVCTCGYVTTLGVVRSNACHVHAPKPAAEKK
jgi:hypothetical protein